MTLRSMDDDFECTSKLLPEPLPGSALLDVCTRLHACGGWQRWPRALANELVQLLAGRGLGIVGYGSSENVAGAQMYLSISEDWEQYALANPWVRPIVDPTYLELDVSSGLGAPGQLVAPLMPVHYPPDAVHPPLLANGSGGYSFVFAAGSIGQGQARHLLAALQALNPGLRGKIYSTSASPVLWL